jgi:acyl carrier protein
MVSDALVIPRVVQGDMCLVCYYIGQADPGAAFIRQYLGSRLPEYMIPASFVKLDAFPLSSNGKIDKKSLPDPELSSGRDTAPKDNLQKELAWIWSQVLKLEEGKIGVTANFFDIGGNSLKLVKLASLINKQFKTELSVSDMFKYPTILSTAQFLAENAGASAGEGDGEMMESVDRLHETVGLLNEIK